MDFLALLRNELAVRVKIDSRTKCWNWTRGTNGYYGMLQRGGKCQPAHRWSYLAFKGSIPKGKSVCHSCDNPLCINPEHLWLGTHRENLKDAARKGRIKNGERTPAWFAAKRRAARARWSQQHGP